MATDKIELRIIAFQEADQWVAQCLEFDIAAQAPTLDALVRRMDATIDAELKFSADNERQPFQGIDPAPDMFAAMWDGNNVSVSAGRARENGPHFDMKIAA